MYKNKFNIPILVNSPLRKGNFIDHYTFKNMLGNYTVKRRTISIIDLLNPFGINIEIRKKAG
jgi:hypothetical protein